MLRGVSCDSIIRAGHKKRLCCIIVPILVDGCKFGHFMLTLLDGFLKKTSFFRNTHDGLCKKRIHEVICWNWVFRCFPEKLLFFVRIEFPFNEKFPKSWYNWEYLGFLIGEEHDAVKLLVKFIRSPIIRDKAKTCFRVFENKNSGFAWLPETKNTWNAGEHFVDGNIVMAFWSYVNECNKICKVY